MIGKKFNFKHIHLGTLIQQKVKENGLAISEIIHCFGCEEKEIDKMYTSETLATELLLIWSKLLDYDFFRIYSEHLILYAPPAKVVQEGEGAKAHTYTRKNIYTRGMIDFILDQLDSGEKTILQIKEEYGIPRSTLHTWIDKYKI
ncbi:transposase [Chryseobacterium nematophagum]|uniref:Transposase n=1 Tax=Chryseobacterium nematophagum TaxID=2305228 RepID=A0A3M7TDH7_9FLAO|nr:transposase [Chryseobacterium nematophagum]RNA61555.1 transposase [Chryseobacterium nematophagum]